MNRAVSLDRMEEVEDPREALRKTLCKAARAHHWMTFMPQKFVMAVSKGNDKEKHYETLKGILAPPSHRIVVLKAGTFILLMSLLPVAYGYTMLEYPCDQHQIRVRDDGHLGKWRNTVLKEDGCVVEDFLRSSFSIFAGPLSIAFFVFIVGCTRLLVHLTGSWNIMYCEVSLWSLKISIGPARLIQCLFYNYLRNKLYKTTFSQIIPAWWYIVGYVVIFAEFFAIALVSRGAPATGLLIATAVSELYLVLTNSLLGVDSAKVAITEAEIQSDSELWKCFQVAERTLPVSTKFLAYIDSRLSDEVLEEDDTLPEYAWPDQIYITDTNAIFKVKELNEHDFGGDESTQTLLRSNMAKAAELLRQARANQSCGHACEVGELRG
eukprot:TRINITY_DN3610_c0_g1_i2.p1 TRINITY_DN3610_c0_g1~~TRINITY_DN3610_c0_g1_i2.p1  ORF type:complete len:380 (+),score=46.97 TRINITY_DN3610_c0_g1_i2:87-1226(+)